MYQSYHHSRNRIIAIMRAPRREKAGKSVDEIEPKYLASTRQLAMYRFNDERQTTTSVCTSRLTKSAYVCYTWTHTYILDTVCYME